MMDELRVRSKTEMAGHRLALARAELKAATEQAKQACRTESDIGVPDARLARNLGVSKITVRAWLGK